MARSHSPKSTAHRRASSRRRSSQTPSPKSKFGVLGGKAPELDGITSIVDARKVIAKLINEHLYRKFPDKPALKPPHHLDHPVVGPYISVGATNYLDTGRYFQVCSVKVKKGKPGCPAAYISNRINENIIINDLKLMRLFLIRDELAPVPRSESTKKPSNPITSSPHYQHIHQIFYSDSLKQNIPALRPRTRAMVNRILSPSPQLSFPSPQPSLPIATPSPEPGPSIPQRSIRSKAAIKSKDVSETEVLELTDSGSSDVEEITQRRPIFLIVWEEDFLLCKHALILSGDDYHFRLSDYKQDLEDQGITTGQALELYHPVGKSWIPLKRHQSLGPVNPGQVFLVRFEGVRNTYLFDEISILASKTGLPVFKGKKRASD